MPALFWAVLAGAALLGGAGVAHLLSGRQLDRTRANLFAVRRLLESTRQANDAAVAPGRETSVPPAAYASPENVREALRLGK